jgi:tetratricopeptide (TPR) repeat protein
LSNKEEYQRRVDMIAEEEEKMRDMGLEVTETLLEREGSQIKDQDKILIRMAEYYIEEAEEKYFEDQEAYDSVYEKYVQELEEFYAGNIATAPEEPERIKYDYSKVISIYDRLMNDYPQSEFADDALYSKSYLLQQMGQVQVARRIFQEVIDRYPDSHFAAESYMRLAEYFFDPREDKDREQSIVELQKAIRLYKKVLQYRDSKRYDEALYKLGWSYYRLTATDPTYYSDAIVYFLAVVDDISKAEKLDPKGKISNPNVKQEAIQYIGISFADEETYAHAGVQNARRFIESIGGREYGVDIMRALGETYQTIEQNDRAIDAYTTLLEMYPTYEEAPLIQQKIAQTYYNLGQDDLEYAARYELFNKYNPGSEWFAYLTSSELPDKLRYEQEAYQLTEQALRTNIALDLEQAQEEESQGRVNKPLYTKVAGGCQEYLEVFPTDTNAYDINWYYAFILDRHLTQFEEAYEQYIHVSNDYLETEWQEESANNAIFVADTLVKISLGPARDTTSLVSLSDQEAIQPEILTAEEKRLIEAYDNYIRLFPEGENTAVYLAAAGAMYFNHKQFAEAKVYFKTLVSRFPGAKEKNIAMRSIMESYFALGQFRDSEFIAKRILNSIDLPEEQKLFAQKRLASSIFNNARLYEEQGQFLEAATEYKRVYDETPEDTTYVEAALFNSGQNYDKVKEWEQALETYTLLADQYPESKYALTALGNAAEDYKELKQFTDAASIYEQVHDINIAKNDLAQAEVALYNASYYFKEGEDWQNSIRINNKYIASYPENDLAVDLYFDNAGHYLKLENLTEANRIYEEFAQRYPNDPRGVESFYRRGEYYEEQGQLNAAKLEFNKAITKSEELNRRGLDPNRYFVGEALNNLVGMLQTEFDAIELRQPASNISARQGELKNLISNITENNTKIIRNGSIRSFEAVYKNAEVYEKFADKYVDQERNPNLDATSRLTEDLRINQESAALYDKAVDEYKKVLDNIPLIAEKFDVDIFAEDTVSLTAAEFDTLYGIQRVVKEDSTKRIALEWYKDSQNKVSYLHYKQADVTKTNIDKALSAENQFKNDLLRGLIFQVQLIGTAVNPAVQQTIEAHKRNIEESEALGLSNKYVEESKRQLLLTSNIPAQELEKLVFSSLNAYPAQVREYRRLIELEYGTTNERGEDYPLIADNVKNIVDYSKTLAINTMDYFAKTLDFAQENQIQSDLIRTTENRMLRIAIELSELYESYHDSVVVFDSLYAEKFLASENYNYDDASLFFQELTFSFNDYEREILDYAFQFKETYDISNLWANKLLGKLIAIDPAIYAGAVERERVELYSDNSWLSTTQYTQGYNQPDFDDSGWNRSSIVPSAYNQFIGLSVDPQSMWYSTQSQIPDTSLTDTLGFAFGDSTIVSDSLSFQPITVTDTLQYGFGDTVDVYFRKNVNLNGTPVDGYIYMTADNDFRLFINEEYIVDDEEDSFAYVDTLDYGYISYFMKPGENIFAIHATDTDNSGGGVKLYAYFELLPADLTAAVAAGSTVQKLLVDPAILKKVNILNKNRITLQTE